MSTPSTEIRTNFIYGPITDIDCISSTDELYAIINNLVVDLNTKPSEFSNIFATYNDSITQLMNDHYMKSNYFKYKAITTKLTECFNKHGSQPNIQNLINDIDVFIGPHLKSKTLGPYIPPNCTLKYVIDRDQVVFENLNYCETNTTKIMEIGREKIIIPTRSMQVENITPKSVVVENITSKSTIIENFASKLKISENITPKSKVIKTKTNNIDESSLSAVYVLLEKLNKPDMGSSLNMYVFEYFDNLEKFEVQNNELLQQISECLQRFSWVCKNEKTLGGFYSDPDRVLLLNELQAVVNPYL